MILDIEKIRLNNKMLVNKDWNYSGIIVDNIRERAPYQCNILQ